MKTIYEFLLKVKTAASTQQDNDYVDLGLPSGLLWARCNIGANKPCEYGDYFMWGSTEPNTNDDCDWKHYPFNNDAYNVCPNGILTPEYDAATVILGPDWRLPTADEFQELIDNTEQKLIKNYKGSKINCMLFEANEAELFIPLSGYRESDFYYRGYYAYLWSSSLYISDKKCAMCLDLGDFYCDVCSNVKYYGFCLRAVKE